MSSKETDLPLYIVDAFTNQAFSGNGAAVCLLPHHFVLSDEVRQKMAAEMNLSETAFVSTLREKDTFQDGRRFGLRWFTPSCEVRLCGHATLASAAVLFMEMGNPLPSLEFETVRSGTLVARRLADGRMELDLPADACEPVELKKYEKVIKAAAGPLPVQEAVLCSSGNLLVRLQDHVTQRELEGRSVSPTDLLSSGGSSLQGLILTLRGHQPYDFVSRYFAPWLGVPEDPVTGSAHCVLGPFWSRILNKTELYAVSIQCWECNSHYDRNCADPFQNETFALTDCDQRDLDHMPNQKATVCRKIVQKVRDDYRFVRGCGWLSNEKEGTECFRRAGTFNVLIQYCGCDRDGCNTGMQHRAIWWLATAAAATLLFLASSFK